MMTINLENFIKINRKLMKQQLSYLSDIFLFLFSIILVIILLLPYPTTAAQQTTHIEPSEHIALRLDVLSSDILHGTAGEFVKIEGKITNLSPSSSDKNNGSGIAYISIVDTKEKIPVDLEDWSVEKGLYIPFIESGHSLPLEWNVRLVKAGSYSVTIIFNTNDDPKLPPIASTRIDMEVAQKHNLNPGNILPIAFGVPAVLIGLSGILNYIRGRKTGIYS